MTLGITVSVRLIQCAGGINVCLRQHLSYSAKCQEVSGMTAEADHQAWYVADCKVCQLLQQCLHTHTQRSLSHVVTST